MNKPAKRITKQEVKQIYSQLQMAKHPNFGPGDTITVSERIFEDKKSRVQKFQGVVLKRRNHGTDENILVRKEGANGIYVEKMFQLHSPLIEEIKIERRGKVRRAYLTYQRKRSGKAARIKELKVIKQAPTK